MSGSNRSLNPKQIVRQQYATAGNLNARQNLHALFSTNPHGWFPWYMEQLDLPAGARVLELGCGPADLWRANHSRLSTGWRVTLTDLSAGMLQTARQNLLSAPSHFSNQFLFAIADAQAIPFSDASFDAVVANHMIYHIPDRALAIREMRRVLRPGGRLYAATNGEHHMQDLDMLVEQLAPDLARESPIFAQNFTLENGPEQLSQAFKTVRLLRYPDNLIVTEARPLVDYVLSLPRDLNNPIPMDRIQTFQTAVEHEIQRRGAIHIGKDTGLLIAS